MPLNKENINAKTDKLNGKIAAKKEKLDGKTAKANAKFTKGKSAVLDKKKKVFGKIAALKTFVEGLPKLTQTNSMPSVSNSNNAIAFLSDLIKSLIGSSKLIEVVIDFLTNNLQEIEDLIKSSLKDELKNIVACGINPSIPDFVRNQGIIIEASKIDFLDIFKVDPTSQFGNLIYNDVTSTLTNSTDFNTFLYGVMQADGPQFTWENMLDIRFDSLGTATRPNNSFTIKTNPVFSLRKLPDLNNSFIDKGKMIDTNKIVNSVIDILYGSISSELKKSLKQLLMEAKIKTVIDRMIETSSNETIDDSFFNFSNEQVYKQEEEASWRKKGILKLECCNKIAATIPPVLLSNFTDEMATATTFNKKEIISTNIDRMAESNTLGSDDPTDKFNIKLNFIQQIINTLIQAISTSIISPKVVFIFLINQKIVYGQGQEYADAIDFIKLGRNLFKLVIKKITAKIVEVLMKEVLKYVGDLTAQMITKRAIEKAANKKAQMLSLTGVPMEALNKLKEIM